VTPEKYVDFDEWLEIEYGNMRKKALKRHTRRGKDAGH
jgi:hypothetical protein